MFNFEYFFCKLNSRDLCPLGNENCWHRKIERIQGARKLRKTLKRKIRLKRCKIRRKESEDNGIEFEAHIQHISDKQNF